MLESCIHLQAKLVKDAKAGQEFAISGAVLEVKIFNRLPFPLGKGNMHEMLTFKLQPIWSDHFDLMHWPPLD